MTIADFQRWLNARGAHLVIDGRGGPRTHAAVLAVFANRAARAATSADIARTAAAIGCTVQQVRAVAEVESAGQPFDAAGHVAALYERHYFFKRWRIKIPFLSDPVPGGYTRDANGNKIVDSWERIADAAMLSPLFAFESASFGRFQIMGAWAQRLGYANAVEFVWALSRSEAAHYDALARFVRAFDLAQAMRSLSPNPETCRAFARGYNGPNYAAGAYHVKLARAMLRF